MNKKQKSYLISFYYFRMIFLIYFKIFIDYQNRKTKQYELIINKLKEKALHIDNKYFKKWMKILKKVNSLY